jgi:HSP20 family molecular chaperone IbpA
VRWTWLSRFHPPREIVSKARERAFSHLSRQFQRSFTVPDGVDTDKIEANFKNGVLTVSLPKTPEAQKQEKHIAIKKG